MRARFVCLRRVVPAVGFCVGGPIYPSDAPGWPLVGWFRLRGRSFDLAALSVPAAMVCNMLRSTLLSALRGNSSTLLRERRMPRLLAEYAPGASKHLLELCSLADFPLLICGTQIGRLKTVAVRLLRPESAYQ